jgi:hypothetical protein
MLHRSPFVTAQYNQPQFDFFAFRNLRVVTRLRERFLLSPLFDIPATNSAKPAQSKPMYNSTANKPMAIRTYWLSAS